MAPSASKMFHAAKRSQKRGMLPGTPVYIGKHAPVAPTLHAIVYNKETFTEKQLTSLEDLDTLGWTPEHHPTHGHQILWLNVAGLADIDLLLQIGKRFEINSLVIEDIVNTQQRTKLDDFEQQLFVVMKMLKLRQRQNGNASILASDAPAEGTEYNGKSRIEVEQEQVSFILGHHFLITFLEDPGDVFDPIRLQLAENRGRVRKQGSDYLFYTLVDAIVDHYFSIVEEFGEYLEQVSDSLLRNPVPTTLRHIHKMKQHTLKLRRCIWPLREVLGHLQRDESSLVESGTKIYIRDVYDHVVEMIDAIETNRDILSGMADMYLSASSYQLNVVMKLLTVISTIFIPLTFITSVYGMNFKYMPELEQPWGYFGVWVVMAVIAMAMLFFFYRKRWLS